MELKALPKAGMQEMSVSIPSCFLNTIILAFKQYPNGARVRGCLVITLLV